jgi:hypothetical protein
LKGGDEMKREDLERRAWEISKELIEKAMKGGRYKSMVEYSQKVGVSAGTVMRIRTGKWNPWVSLATLFMFAAEEKGEKATLDILDMLK